MIGIFLVFSHGFTKKILGRLLDNEYYHYLSLQPYTNETVKVLAFRFAVFQAEKDQKHITESQCLIYTGINRRASPYLSQMEFTWSVRHPV